MRKLMGFLAVVLVMASNAFAADVYSIDKSHSNIGFSVAHMMVSKTVGTFSDYDGVVSFDPQDLAGSKVDVTIKVASIDTRDAKRDGHLKTADFFDAAQFADITFKSKSISGQDGTYQITGDLTIKGVTKEVTLPVTISGPVASPFGGTLIGLNSTFVINRQDYGITWNKDLDKGGVAVGNDVTVTVSIEAKK